MTALWTWDDLLAAAGARAQGTASEPVMGFSIDTRTIVPGDVFVALKDVRDGHDFVTQAFAKGATAALVSKAYVRKADDGALLRVADPLRALEGIGRAARQRLAPSATVIALTGSAGKTGTKEMLRACLTPYGATHAPEKSYNNHWGVPLTLARMPTETAFGVFEIGMNHAGEITPLTKLVAPHIAIVTNVLPVHIGNFANGEIGVANAKSEIFLGCSAGGYAVLPRDNAHYDRLEIAARAKGLEIVSFGTDARATVRASALETAEDHSELKLASGERYRVGAPGRHLAFNSLAVAATLTILGLPLAASLAPLAKTTVPAGRGARTILQGPGGTVLLIDESYNANPASMRAALAAMATTPRTRFARRIAVMGDMRELGSDADDLHLRLAEAVVAAETDVVLACGPHMRRLFDALPQAIRGAWAATSDDLVPELLGTVRAGDAVMIKGSLGTHMAPLVEALKARYQAAGST